MDKSWKKMDNTVMGKNKDFHTSALPVGDSVRYSAQLPEPDWKSGRVAHKVCRPKGRADPPCRECGMALCPSSRKSNKVAGQPWSAEIHLRFPIAQQSKPSYLSYSCCSGLLHGR